jgi:hypothetical protein
MSTVNYANPKLDTTVKIFDEFYQYETVVSAQEYDAVYSYFRSQFGTSDAAGNFTVTLFRVAEESGESVMNLLYQIEGLTGPELTLTLAYYLNALRSPSTLLGVNVPTQPNYYAARNIRA